MGKLAQAREIEGESTGCQDDQILTIPQMLILATLAGALGWTLIIKGCCNLAAWLGL
jgi:hypothetical protein